MVVSSIDKLQQQDDYRTHQCKSQSWGKDVHLTEKVLHNYIQPRLDNLRKNMAASEYKETAEEAILRLASSVSIMVLCERFELTQTYKDKDIARPLLFGLTLRCDKITKACVDYEALVEVHFNGAVVHIANRLEGFLSHMVEDHSYYEADWLRAVPLYHFLKQKTAPYQALEDTKIHRSPEWWGTSGIEKTVNRFQKIMYYKDENDMPLNFYFRVLGPLFEVDKLLPRTLVACTSWKHLEFLMEKQIIEASVFFANMYYALSKSSVAYSELEMLPRLLGLINQKLTSDISRRERPGEKLPLKLQECECDISIAMDFVKQIFRTCKTTFRRNTVELAMRSVVLLVRKYVALIEVVKSVNDKETAEMDTTGRVIIEDFEQVARKSVRELQNSLRIWLQDALPVLLIDRYPAFGMNDSHELEIFDWLLNEEIPFEQDTWRNFFLDILKYRLEKISQKDRLELFCRVDCDKHHPLIQHLFSNAAFNAIEEGLRNPVAECSFLFDLAGYGDALKFNSLLSRVFKTSWPKTDDRIRTDVPTVLSHILNWTTFVKYLEFFYGTERSAKLLDSNTQELIVRGISVFETVYEEFINGKMTVQLMHTLLPKHAEFKEICKVYEKSTGSQDRQKSKEETFKDIFPKRKAELDTFEKLKTDLQIFADLCHILEDGGNIEMLDELKAKLEEDVHAKPLCDLCVPQMPGAGSKSKPRITWFKVPNAVLEVLDDINRNKHSVTFDRKWKKIGRAFTRQQEDIVSFEDIVENVWIPTYNELRQLVNSLQKGTVTFLTIDDIFGNFKQNYKEMKVEMRELCKGVKLSPMKWIDATLKQIEEYQQLVIYRRGARIMNKIREGFNLTGNFDILDILISAGENKNTKLLAINDEVVRSGKALKGINEEKFNCIGVFHKALPLVEWLRESVKDTKEIKVLVDLAMMSAQGQGDIEVHRAQILHACAVGYAPLIYELKPTAGFKEFLQQCQQVWKSLESDPKLPTKLEDTALYLDWLKNVKESHGSVELDALSQAENINARGIYYVGCLNEKDDNIKQSLEEVLLLKVPPEKKKDIEDKEKWRTYKYEKLKDLQSKLMLVAGKAAQGKDQVDRFMEIFDGITRLGSTYVKLCKAGSILFRKWNVTFYCEPKRNIHTIVDFGLSGNQAKQGTSAFRANVSDQIKDLCEFLETCLEEWQENIDIKRKEFYFLNNFTTEQLVILRREIAVCFEEQSGEKVSPRIYPMLSSVKKNCTQRDLQVAIAQAMADLAKAPSLDIDMEEETSEEAGVENMDIGDESEKPPTETGLKFDKAELKKYLEEMKYSGFSEKLALKALEAEEVEGPECVEEASLWCLNHEDDFSEDEEEFMDAKQSESDGSSEGERTEIGSSVDPPGGEVRNYSHVMQTVTLAQLTKELLAEETQSKNSLKAQLSEVWDNYMKMSATSSVSDFLSVEHLGYILEQLADVEVPLERPLQPSLPAGRPNLIVCPQGEMLQHVLSLYMFEQGVHVRLPTSEEVLLCTPHTHLEEVELLFRRAVGMHKEGKIFCLVNADRLDYEVSKKAEKKFEEYAKGIMDYRVVILCSRENEDKSFMVTAFDRHRVRNTALSQSTAIQDYLKKHFCISGKVVKTAADLDPQRSCVRVVKSERAGVGKSLKAQRLSEQIRKRYPREAEVDIHLSLHRKTVDVSEVLKELLKYTRKPGTNIPRLLHINIAHEVQEGVDDLLFSLLILGTLTDDLGYVWLRSDLDLYIIEVMPLQQKEITTSGVQRLEKVNYVHQVFHYLPSMMCWSPMQSLDILQQIGENKAVKLPEYPDYQPFDQLMDPSEFKSPVWQQVFQYLMCYSTNQDFNLVNPTKAMGDMNQCITVLLRHCGLNNPSWAELRHFVSFLNAQLLDCDNSNFCSVHLAEDLPGFRMFVVKSMIQMSRDFATRSLNISEQTPGIQDRRTGARDLEVEDFQMKRRWETSPHPYAFFNADHHSMTFLGFNIDAQGNMIDQVSGEMLDRDVMPKPLQDALRRNHVPLNENFDNLQRAEKITKLCQVMGNEFPYDPDPTYVLTTDNTKKILAIYMRFRCGIPVIIMGETGCGKTRLIKFMCDLQKPPGVEMNNMVLMKVHGGTTADDINKKIDASMALAMHNRREYPNVDTVVFFDEANTTEEIGLIKQVMCDQNLMIKNAKNYGLRIVAACNPYRKHSQEMIKKLEQAGLGYHIEADQTTDKLGQIPMRRLVYRVQALPKSMIPLVWDFGQLDTKTEQSYIQQMVQKFVSDGALPNLPNIQVVVSRVLTASQDFMRDQKDECSFVSLRDVERTLKVMAWFYLHRVLLFELMDAMAEREMEEDGADPEEELAQQGLNETTRCLVLALGVCYHACLENREEYREHVARHFVQPLPLPGGADTFSQEVNRCQNVFLDQVQLEDNIARNQALKENLFMMIVCIELRIPLFLVGKPGSSKSLAKTIVHDAMQGDAARSELFREFKLIHMVSYQCSPLSTPDGIVSTFKQCAALQKEKNLDEFVSVVVLDEVGLAEDSPRMPLKTLHPLLEDGCEGDEDSKPYMKVAFIGISNWALDPAKMNRGILVQRGVPNKEELQDSAEGICARNKQGQINIRPYIRPMAQAYLELYNSALKIREFFGLRDFYSIIKMVYSFSKRSGQPPTWHELKHSILRNFGGLDGVDPMAVFEKHLIGVEKHVEKREHDPDCSPEGLIWACLFSEGLEGIECENRYLLILTENYAALKILQQQLTRLKDAIYIFGSSFPKDQEYTQVCRNINRIKVCMETGQTVVLLNLENLYESLYDALNQYYVYLGGQRFVDLGLGSHRVKCKVHEDFRLIVVAEKQVVYKKFPIPLINRLEKHTLTMETVLSEDMQELARQLDHWAKAFAAVNMTVIGKKANKFSVGDVFIGYDKDTACSVVLQVAQQLGEDAGEISILDKSKEVLLQCATPEAIVRLKKSRLQREETYLADIYFRQQQHDNLTVFLAQQLAICGEAGTTIFAQVSTHSKLLSRSACQQIARQVGMSRQITLESLQEFHTEQQFCKQLSKYFESESKKDQVLILQCDTGDENATLIASAQHSIIREFRNQQKQQVEEDASLMRGKKHVVFIIQLPRRPGGCFVGFQGGEWMSYHIDELRPQQDKLPSLVKLKENSVGTLFEKSLDSKTVQGGKILERMVQSVDDDSGSDMLSEYADMPPLEGYTEEDYIREGHKPGKQATEEETMEVDEDNWSRSQQAAGDAGRILENRNNQAQQPEAMETEDDTEFDVAAIIKNCIHGAASMLEDSETNTNLQRKTKRVQLLLQLLDQKPKEGELSLIEVIKLRVVQLLKDKEENATTPERAKQWLTNEAASSESISRAGTFIRSVWQNIEAKVTPILAYIIAYSDQNANLDLLSSPARDLSWIQQYWLRALAAGDIVGLTYKGLQTASQRRDVERFLVANHGCQETEFNCALPFSWLVKENVDLMVHTNIPEGGNPLTMFNKVFHKSSIGLLMLDVVGRETDPGYAVFVHRYVQDYVRMMYKCYSTTPQLEYQLIEDSIRVAALEEHTISTLLHQTLVSDDDDSEATEQPLPGPFFLSIPLVHVTFDRLSSRLRLFGQAIEAWPNAVEEIHQFKQGNTGHVLNTGQEFTLDILMLHFVLENLAPKREEIDNIEKRFEWIKKVKQMSPVVERMLASASENVPDRHEFGEACTKFLPKCRAMWSRVYAVQLFIEHVCPKDVPVEKLSTKRVLPLWTTLGDETDFQRVKSFENIEKFLTICNRSANKHYLGESSDCASCGKTLVDPVKIPCKDEHVVCLVCIETELLLKQPRCPFCSADLPKGFKPAVNKQKAEAREGFSAYRQRCNAFFMELVSSLCFPGDVPPENAVIQKLLNYVTKESKDAERQGDRSVVVTQKMNVCQDSIDPTPVVRSFLLQLLLRSNVDQVKDYLELYFERTRRIVSGGNQEHLVELCLLFVHCFEDANHTQYEQEKTVGKARGQIKKLLEAASSNYNNMAVNVQKLEAIAGARFGLYIVSEWMYKAHVSKELTDSKDLKTVFQYAAHLCTNTNNTWPRLYLMRQISRRFGMDSLLKLGDVGHLAWILPPEARQNKDDGQPDRFIVCEDGYREVREALTLSLLEADFSKLDTALKDSKVKPVALKERNLLLALYTEVTMSHRLPEERRGLKAGRLEELGVYLNASKNLKNKQLADAVVRNDLGNVCRHLTIKVNQDRKIAMISQLVVHYRITLNIVETSHFVEPLLFLMNDPRKMTNCFLPTMPQDDLEYIHETLLGARNRNQRAVPGVDHNYVFYKCPNGHPYTIGDCGNPAYVGTCKECNARIGGQNYQLETGNERITDFKDAKSHGHILGPARQRSKVPAPERELTAANCAIIRLLSHIALYLAANEKADHVGALVVPPIQGQEAAEYFWGHILVDLEVIAKALNRSTDDSVLLLHIILDNMIKMRENARGIDSSLSTKKARQEWEKRFTAVYIAPLLQGLEERLHAANQRMLNDDRLGSNPLLKILYEADVPPNDLDIQHLQDIPAIWRIRSRVTIEHLTHELTENLAGQEKKKINIKRRGKGKAQREYPVLMLFLQHEPMLRAVRFLPAIVQLQRMLVQRFHGAIDRAEATQLTVGSWMNTKLQPGPIKEEYQQLIKDFSEAWTLVKAHLASFGFRGLMLPKEYTNMKIDSDTPLAMLLPSYKGQGLCSIAMVYFLATVQNNFLENYSQLSKISIMSHTSVQDATAAHLVSYVPDRDLLPLVLANCNYSLSVGGGDGASGTTQGTSLQYDFNGLEKRVEEKFIRGRTRIKPHVEAVVFRADFTNAGVFETIRKKINQECLDSSVQQQIISESKHLTEVTDSLATLDIALGFLVSVGGDGETRLAQFISKTLEMKKSLHSAAAMGHCRLKHVQAVWLLLSQERAKIQAKYDQDALDTVATTYHEELSQEQIAALHNALQYCNPEHLLSELYECIMLKISAPQDENDPEAVDNRDHPLGYVLNEYMEAKDNADEKVLSDDKFPGDILLKHSVSTWLHINRYIIQTAKH